MIGPRMRAAAGLLWAALLPVGLGNARAAGDVVVNITDAGFSPAQVAASLGSSVTWVNTGQKVHSVVTDAGISPTVNSGGLAPGQRFSFMFTSPGTYTYHSSTEPSYSYDSSGNAYTGYALAGTVTVPGPAAAATPTAPTSVSCNFVLGFKTLHDLDPADIGDCLTNQTSASNGDARQQTTKGLMAWRKADNWTAFTNGYTTWINGPSGLASRLNTARFPWEHDTAGASGAPAAAPTPSADPLVTIDDTNGFTPNYVIIQAGHTVTWINKGQQAHSVVNNNGNPPFNSGALRPGQMYSYNFVLPGGDYTYHSSTEPSHLYKDANGVDTIGWAFQGRIIVQ
ncbi:MAG: cupredoxin domain-containing protein [Chloroflexota bacterium]